MAKINIALSAQENVLALINTANPGLNATLDQILPGAPVAAAGTGGRNATVTFTAIENEGFSGQQTYSYTRRTLAVGSAIATAKAIPVVIAPADTDSQVLTKVAAGLGLIASEIELADIVRPVNEDTNGSANVNAISTSLLYLGTYAVVLSIPDADVPLDEASPVTDLDGFDAEE